MSRDILECRCFHNLSFMHLNCISCSDAELIYRIEAEKDFFTMHFGYLMCDKSMVFMADFTLPRGKETYFCSVHTERALHSKFSPVLS